MNQAFWCAQLQDEEKANSENCYVPIKSLTDDYFDYHFVLLNYLSVLSKKL